MARAKRPSDDLYNARRRAKRQAERLDRQGRNLEAASLRETVAASYGKGATVNIAQLNAAVSNARTSSIESLPPVSSINRTANAPIQPKKPRPKRPSDELYNARRRLRRQAEKLEREAKQAKNERERQLTEGYAQFLRAQAEKTKGTKLTAQQRKQEIERLGTVRKASKDVTYGRFKIARRNAIFMQQLNAAGTEGATSSISDRKKSVFWAATKGLWPKGSNVPRNQRYDMIASHFFNDHTTDAQEFRRWLIEEKGVDPTNVYGDLQLIFEYITEELNDPAIYELPDLPYGAAMDVIKTAM